MISTTKRQRLLGSAADDAQNPDRPTVAEKRAQLERERRELAALEGPDRLELGIEDFLLATMDESQACRISNAILDRFGVVTGRELSRLTRRELLATVGISDPTMRKIEAAFAGTGAGLAEEQCFCQPVRHGYDRNGIQRFRCRKCGKTTLAPRPPRQIPDSRVPRELELQVIAMLGDCSDREISRATGVHRDTIARIRRFRRRTAQGKNAAY